jgi:hypothetical protein
VVLSFLEPSLAARVKVSSDENRPMCSGVQIERCRIISPVKPFTTLMLGHNHSQRRSVCLADFPFTNLGKPTTDRYLVADDPARASPSIQANYQASTQS